MEPLSREHRDTHTEKDTEPIIYRSQPCDTRSGLTADKIKGVVTVYNKTIQISCFILSYHFVIKYVENRVAKAWSKWRELSGVICDKKIPTKLKLLIYQTVIRPTLLYGCETWPMSVKDEKRTATTEMRMVRWAMGVSLLEHRRNEEILEEAKVEAIATVMRRRRLEWFGHVKRRGETENIRAVAEMKMEGKRPRGRPKLRWKDTIRRDLKAWKIKEEWATDREKWKGLCKNRYPEQGDGGER